MKSFNNQHVVITGGSSGIGFEIAIQLAAQGAKLRIMARDIEKLGQTKILILEKYPLTDIEVFQCDVSVQEQVKQVINIIGTEYGGIDVLINNAGSILCGRLTDNSMDDHEKILKTNYFGMFYATYCAWPFIKQSQQGHIGFVSSVAGYVGAIGYTGYAPSKFAVSGLAESLRMEAKEAGIDVTVIYPPDTETPFLKYERENTLPETKELSKTAKVMPASLVAQKMINAMAKKKFEVICNFESKLVRVLKVLFPISFFNGLDKIVKI